MYWWNYKTRVYTIEGDCKTLLENQAQKRARELEKREYAWDKRKKWRKCMWKRMKKLVHRILDWWIWQPRVDNIIFLWKCKVESME